MDVSRSADAPSKVAAIVNCLNENRITGHGTIKRSLFTTPRKKVEVESGAELEISDDGDDQLEVAQDPVDENVDVPAATEAHMSVEVDVVQMYVEHTPPSSPVVSVVSIHRQDRGVDSGASLVDIGNPQGNGDCFYSCVRLVLNTLHQSRQKSVQGLRAMAAEGVTEQQVTFQKEMFVKAQEDMAEAQKAAKANQMEKGGKNKKRKNYVDEEELDLTDYLRGHVNFTGVSRSRSGIPYVAGKIRIVGADVGAYRCVWADDAAIDAVEVAISIAIFVYDVAHHLVIRWPAADVFEEAMVLIKEGDHFKCHEQLYQVEHLPPLFTRRMLL